MFRRQTIRELGRPTLVLGLAAVCSALGGLVVLGVALSWSDELRDGGLGVLLMLLAAGTVGCGLWLMPTHVLSLVCGWSLGLPVGAAVALLGATLGSPLGYVIGGKLAGPGALVWAERYPKGAAVCAAITKASPWRAGWLVGLLRLSPVVPYGATNVLAAAFKLRPLPFVWGTALGLAPRVAVVAGLGAGLEQLEMTKPEGWGWLVLGVVATGLMIASFGWATRDALRRVAAEHIAEVGPDESPTPAAAGS